jgi:hypothetical protein
MEIITTIADERNKNISIRSSFLPGICVEQIIWPYSGDSIRFNFSDYDLEPNTTYIFHVNANFLNKHNLLSTSYFCKGKDFEALPVLNATADQERIKNGEYMGNLKKINQEDLFEINSYHIDMDESKPPQRNPKVQQLTVVRVNEELSKEEQQALKDLVYEYRDIFVLPNLT